MTKHELDLGRSALTCSLCTEIVTGDHKARVTHVENHLIEIALSVMPTGGDYDAEEDLSPVKSVLSSPHARQVYGTESDVSGYDSNRRRRRAERAQAKAARSGGSRVEFS
jgi:hypothetical protein